MRILFWLSYPDVTIAGIFGGKTIVGGLLGGLAGVEIAKKIAGVTRSTGDRFVLPLLVAMSIGRIGCFLTGPLDRTAGVPSSVPWAIAIGDGVRRHPVALYEIAFLLLLTPVLLWIRRHSAVEGDSFRAFMIAYLAFRLFEDFLKPDPPRIYGGMSAIEWACIAGLSYYAAVLIPRMMHRPAEA
jgi:phosphatidylglycerol---prolipoprotein diacylglyceryl transferase